MSALAFLLLGLGLCALSWNFAVGQQCGWQAGGALCAGNLCCSQFGWCGSTAEYCEPSRGCLSRCWGSGPGPTPSFGMGSIVTLALFEQMMLHRNNTACHARNFYTYNAFITAANSFPAFGNTGDLATRRKEIAAFFGQTSHETTGGWPTAPDRPYAWGYCFVVEQGNLGPYCSPSAQWPCALGKSYFGRGPFQLTHNYNYRPAGRAICEALLANPNLVSSNAVISFKTALWFWMTLQPPKPSAHDVITGAWRPSTTDATAGRQPGYGVITNIINDGLECGRGSDSRVISRIRFYNRYYSILQASPGPNLDYGSQKPFA